MQVAVHIIVEHEPGAMLLSLQYAANSTVVLHHCTLMLHKKNIAKIIICGFSKV